MTEANARVLVAMSGGVDSSVAAAMLVERGHDVTGVTLKLWGGESDSGCCSVSDVEDARRVAAQLAIPHYVFNFSDDFTSNVVDPYVDAYSSGRTPNPCVECNRSIKFGRLLDRAKALGFDLLATGHHARVLRRGTTYALARGADEAKDQSYVLYMLGQRELSRSLFPVGDLLKAQGRHNMRPAHLHFLIYKPGFKTHISQVYLPDDPNIETDVQFGVTRRLLGDYVRHEGEKAPAPGVKDPWFSLDYTFIMEPGVAKLPRAPIQDKATTSQMRPQVLEAKHREPAMAK